MLERWTSKVLTSLDPSPTPLYAMAAPVEFPVGAMVTFPNQRVRLADLIETHAIVVNPGYGIGQGLLGTLQRGFPIRQVSDDAHGGLHAAVHGNAGHGHDDQDNHGDEKHHTALGGREGGTKGECYIHAAFLMVMMVE